MTRLFELVCGGVAALALFAIMVLTFFDVIGRKLLSQSIPGSLELTEMLMVLVIFAALPLVSLRGEHVTFDSLDSVLPKAVRWFQLKIVHLLAVAVFVGVGWLMWKTGIKFSDQGDISSQLAIPKAPFIYAMAVFLWGCALIHFGLLFKPLDDDSKNSGQDAEVSAL
jgi:TRAP-type transport system small permease protein